jgi:small-conductance mechanosensitive channel
MRNTLKSLFFVVFMLLVGGSPTLWAADLPAPVTTAAAPLPVISQSDLQALQQRLDGLKQQISAANNYNQLEGPQDRVQAFILDVDRLSAALLPQQAQLAVQLGVLGAAPDADLAAEQADIVAQRASLAEQKSKVDGTLKSLAALKQSAADLITQIAGIRRTLLESELTLGTDSVLSPSFWSPLVSPSDDDRQRLRFFVAQVRDTWATVWAPGERFYTSVLMALALIIWTFGRRLAERGLTWVCIYRMPEGRLRRSALAFASALATIATTAIALQLLFYACTRHQPLPPVLETFSEEFEKVVYACVLLTGLSRALLSTEHPSWRLPAIADQVALALKPYPRILSCTLLVLVTLVQVSNATGMSSQIVIAGRGVISIVVLAIVTVLLLRVGKVRKALVAANDASAANSTFAGVIYTIASISMFVSAIALLTGYVSLARFISYELVWAYIVLSGFYLLIQLIKDACEHVFSPRHASGKALKQLLGIGDRRLDQIEILLSGFSRAALLLLAVIALFVGGIGTTLGQLASNIMAILGGAGLRKLNIVPGHLLNAVLALMIGIWLIRALRRWLDNEFLPKTDMDPGMCASLSTLFSNIGYAFVILLTLSSLGVQWTNLAWIVSALSVGIGFGLQEIVKNFVSGLILLTERPVKVGDLISISGVEGDIRRINVRATEIQLSDRSIVIVPNSQLISQNLRNVTLGGSAQGVASLELVFPLDIDPEEVKDLLLNTYRENETILDKPAPFVRFSKLSPDGITLTVTGYVGSPRIVGVTKSDLLFEILKRLGAAEIALAKPPASA